MPDVYADAALVGPTQPPLRSDPPGAWDFPDEPVAPPTPTPVPPEPVPATTATSIQPEEFDPRHREPFQGLLWLGHLTKSVSFYGHSFTLVTPSGTERVQMGEVCKAYQGTFTEEIAFSRVMVAAYLTKVDGSPLPEPVLNSPKDTALADRFRWVNENIRTQTIIDKIFQECLLLEATVDATLEAMGKA